MKFDSFQFPHPVLTNFTDDINGELSFDEEIIDNEDSYSIDISYMLDNQILNNYLSENRAKIICEVNCSSTVYRDSFISKGKTISFQLDKEKLRGLVEFSSYLISKQDIIGYLNPNSHTDYEGFSFEIEPGDVLAYFGDFSFNAEINYKKLKAVSSFLKIEERNDIKISDFDINNDRIIIKLPVRDYSIYRKQPIAKNVDFAPIFHASIVFSALIYALQNIEKHEDKMWAQVVKTRLEEDEFQEFTLDSESGDLIQIAQILLGNPVNRLMKVLESISEKYTQ
ncbi:MAG: hypothetical protein JJ892_09745 [Balneola sp.]|nr:hypothetical protein [Balneola sp.]MBO6649792.1 hypothetical protein [Balneola sp.]MBO6712355.1 hypothetical protein [Balneola sp.]MBO6800549.1 hypothetical protein [Balneola sp.]MBO6871503.1 hypothetical protein [Balneola sp.]